MEEGRIVVDARQVADTDLGAGRPGHAVAVRTALGLDDDHAVGGGGAVERGASGALHDFDRLDVERADLVQVPDAHHRAVHDDQRTGRAAGAVDRRRAAEHDLRVRTRLAARLRDAEAGHLAGERAERVERRHREVFRRQLADRERHLGALRAFERSGHGDFRQAVDVAPEREVVRLVADAECHLRRTGRVADRTGAERDRLTGRARCRDAQREDTRVVRRHRERELRDENVRHREGLTALTRHLARDDGRLCLGLRHGCYEQHAQQGATDHSERVQHGPDCHTSPLVRKGGGTTIFLRDGPTPAAARHPAVPRRPRLKKINDRRAQFSATLLSHTAIPS